MARTLSGIASRLTGPLLKVALRSGLGSRLAAHAVSRWLTAPTRCYAARPQLTNTRCREITCRTLCGQIQLSGWAIEPRRPIGTVALFHGYRRSRSHLLTRMQSLLNENWRCVAFDHRAHGQSDGKLTSFGYHEREDVRAVYALIQQQWPHQPAVALGVSMGAAAICYAAEVGVKWDAVVLESVYDNIVSTFQRRIGGPYPDWFGLLIPPVAEMIEQRLSLKVDDLVPQRALLQLQPTPLLVVHGAQDEFAPAEIARQIHQSYSGPSELWMIDGAGHYDLWEIAGDRYGKRVVSFLNRQTRRATRSPRAA